PCAPCGDRPPGRRRQRLRTATRARAEAPVPARGAARLPASLRGGAGGRRVAATRRSVRGPRARQARCVVGRMRRFFAPDPADQSGWRCRRSTDAGSSQAPPAATKINQKGDLIPMSVVSMRELLEAGVHFGHQTRRWNPKMRRFIFTERGGIYIIDLQQTLQLLEEAHDFARNLAERGGSILFVGTKKQSQGAVE